MLAVLRHATADTVMMIGHNPGIAEFAHRLVSKTPVSPEFRKYPTGATLVVDFAEESWSEVSFGQGVTVDFIVPREIVGEARFVRLRRHVARRAPKATRRISDRGSG
jgi:phosphohistidine phosphatase